MKLFYYCNEMCKLNYIRYQNLKRKKTNMKQNEQKKKTNKQFIIQLTTITLVIYHRQQHFVTASHRDRSLCAQISSNIEGHSPSWSRGQGMKRCISSSSLSFFSLSFAFEHARNWLHNLGLYRLQQMWEYLLLKFSNITIHIMTTNIMLYCYDIVSILGKRREYTNLQHS